MSALTSKNLRLISITFVITYALFGFTDVRNHHYHMAEEEPKKSLESLQHKSFSSPTQRPRGPTPTPLPPSSEIDNSVEPRGQVNEYTAFGLALMDLAALPGVDLILETGTFFGGGSTLCIAKSLKKKGRGRLVSIESFEEPNAYASKTLRGYPVELLLGTTVSPEDFPTPLEVKMTGATFESSEEDWIHFLNEEKKKSAQYSSPLLKSLCLERPFDAVLIDGAEFSGPKEFAIVMEHCKYVQYIALHDTNTFKGRASRANLTDNPEWSMEWGDVETNEWAIFKRRDNT